LKELIKHIVQALVDHPEQVRVNEIEATQASVLELRVAKSDLGQIIGKHGRTVEAVRVVLFAASGKARRRYVLEIVE
jgi:hypothetical protein